MENTVRFTFRGQLYDKLSTEERFDAPRAARYRLVFPGRSRDEYQEQYAYIDDGHRIHDLDMYCALKSIVGDFDFFATELDKDVHAGMLNYLRELVKVGEK